MMVYLPAIFFGLCFFNSIRKYGWNVESYLFLLYFATGIASIMIDVNNLYDYSCLKMDLGFFAPVSYCLFLYICIKPFGYLFRGDIIKKVDAKNEKIIDLYIYFHFVVFLIIFSVASTRINEILFNTAMVEVRRQAYAGDVESFYNAYSGWPRYICALSTFFYASAFLCLFLFFYNLVYRKKAWWFHVMTLMASTPQLIASILQADRSQFLYWGILFIFAYTVFRKFLNRASLRKLLLFAIPLLGGGVVYFLAVTISRWGEGNSDGWVVYMGMNYINYCNYLHCLGDAPISLCELFPFTYFLLGEPDYFSFAAIVEQRTHVFVATFPTFLGLICSISGIIVMILFVFIYHSLSVHFLKRKDKERVTLFYLIKMWVVVLVPLLGIFGYFYMSYTATLAIIFWLMFGNFTNRRWKRIGN